MLSNILTRKVIDNIFTSGIAVTTIGACLILIHSLPLVVGGVVAAIGIMLMLFVIAVGVINLHVIKKQYTYDLPVRLPIIDR